LPSTPPFSESPEESLTPTRRPSAAHTAASTASSPHGTESSSSSLFTVGRSTTRTTGSVSSLASLKDLIASAETALYKRLGQSSLEDLGDVRRAFISSASDTYQRLQSSIPPGVERTLPDILPTLPEWWKPRTHCLPTCSVIVRESEWGSIIAFTLR
jgi:1-phosphatidylinositol-3-phosphate 5-kinase